MEHLYFMQLLFIFVQLIIVKKISNKRAENIQLALAIGQSLQLSKKGVSVHTIQSNLQT
jgi:hypothetical protein